MERLSCICEKTTRASRHHNPWRYIVTDGTPVPTEVFGLPMLKGLNLEVSIRQEELRRRVGQSDRVASPFGVGPSPSRSSMRHVNETGLLTIIGSKKRQQDGLMHKFFRNTWLDFEVIRILGTAPNGGAELCEVLEAVAAITEGDAQSWHNAWKIQADRAEATAYRCFKDGNRELAKRAFLRASNYTRASQYMFIGATPSQQDPRCLPIAERGIDLFKKGVELLDGDVKFLDIPYPGGIFLKGYLYLPHPSKRVAGKTPILVNCGGADSIQEELYFLNPSAAPDLGYACLTFDGPGQGLTLRKDGLTLRPDWEHVIRHVLDYLTAYSKKHPDLDLDRDRIAISGSALGGYLSLRGATDPRIKACVAMDPLYDMWDFGTQHVSPAFINAWMSGWLSKSVVDSIINVGARFNFQLKWEISVSGAFWKLDCPTDILLEMKKYTFRQKNGKNYLDGVSCPTLISGAANSLYLNVESHTMMVWQHLNSVSEQEKELWMANTPADGALQAKIGAFGLSNEYTFRFLDEKLGVVRGGLNPDQKSL